MKIAAFDSGIGGLTAIAPMLRKFRGLEITYLGDRANLPYGTKSPERLRELTRKNLEWVLSSQNFDLGIVACNTASAHGMSIAQELGRARKIPVVGVIESGCLAALRSASKRILVLGTSATIESRSYVKGLENLGRTEQVSQQACPLFVPLVEENLEGSPAAEWAVRHYLEGRLHPGDAAILGCTHYPFLVPVLEKTFPGVEWIDAGAALIEDPLVKTALEKPRATRANQLKLLFTDALSENKIRSFLDSLHLGDTQWSLEVITPLV